MQQLQQLCNVPFALCYSLENSGVIKWCLFFFLNLGCALDTAVVGGNACVAKENEVKIEVNKGEQGRKLPTKCLSGKGGGLLFGQIF